MKKIMMMLTAAMTLTACDYIEKQDFKKERASSEYRSAMEDYRAGRLAEAVKGLKNVCYKDPANASARFQLACLLQDYSKDYLGAICAYTEYLMQHPESEKTSLASKRRLDCEKLLASELSSKYGLNNVEEQLKRIEEITAQVKAGEDRNRKLAEELAKAESRIAALTRDNDRMNSMLRDENAKLTAEEIKDAKDLLDEADDAIATPLIVQAPDAKEKRDQARAEQKAARAAEKAEKESSRPKLEARPEVYTVVEGDTLYQIASRFYGRSSAWRLIRDANKAVISTDGRIRPGQKLRLPAE